MGGELSSRVLPSSHTWAPEEPLPPTSEQGLMHSLLFQQLMKILMSLAMTPSSPHPHTPPPPPGAWTASMRRQLASSSWLSSGPRTCPCSPTCPSGIRYTRQGAHKSPPGWGHIPPCAGDDWRCMWLGDGDGWGHPCLRVSDGQGHQSQGSDSLGSNDGQGHHPGESDGQGHTGTRDLKTVSVPLWVFFPPRQALGPYRCSVCHRVVCTP